jgi:glycosyltransferase involved in cell wall biosynthesis
MKRKRIVYVQYTNPAGYPPLEHSSQILAESGWEVLFLGTGALGADKLKLPEHERITIRQIAFQGAGWKQKLHYLGFHLWCFAWILRWRPSWIYVSDLLSCPFGWLAALAGMRVIFHEHDSPSSEASGRFARFLLDARKQCARHAELCVIPNAARGQFLMQSAGISRPPVVVWNCPRLSEVALQREPIVPERLRLLYHGSIVPERLPLAVIDALARLPEGVTLTVVGYETVGSRGYTDKLKGRAAELRIQNRLGVLGTLATRQELISVCRNHDAGFALMPSSSGDLNLRTMAGASNKPFDYLACGLALLVSDLPEWNEMFVERGYGVACSPESASDLAAAIGRLYSEAAATRAMGERGRQQVLREWNYEHQFQPVRDTLTGHANIGSVAADAGPEPYRPEAIR